MRGIRRHGGGTIMAKKVELLAGYWTIAGDRYPMGPSEISPFSFRERAEAAAAAGYTGMGLVYHDIMANAAKMGLGGMKKILDDNGIAHIEVEFLGDDLGQRRANAGAEIDMAVERHSLAVRRHGQIDLRRVRAAGFQDEQHVGLLEVEHPAGFARSGHAAPASLPVDAVISARARRTAARISTCVPQRHRCRRKAARISASLAFGLRDSRPTVAMIMPFRQ